MGRVLSLYRALRKQYGPQCWWPADSRYEVVVGALLTQNTSWKNVERAIANLKDADALDPGSILAIGIHDLESLIRPSGFFRQKAVRLKALTSGYVRFMENGRPPSRQELLDIKGVGEETADSILLYAYGLPFFVIDAYTRRFCSSNRLIEAKKYGEYQSFFESALPRDVAIYKEYHALIVRWGKDAKRERRPERPLRKNKKTG